MIDMVSIAGSKKLKRQMAPVFWGIDRKRKRFVMAQRPGPHPHDRSIPTAVFLRDMLGVVYTMREAKAAIYGGGVMVDRKVRKSLHFGIGLMDVVRLQNMKDAYRMVPLNGKLLQPLAIPDDEDTKKLVKITGKVTIKGGRTALGMHDGRTIITDVYANVGDSCLLEVPTQEILEVIPLEVGCLVLVISGANAGQIGRVESIENGTFILPKRAVVSLKERSIQIPTDAVMVIGETEAVIQVTES